MKKSDEASDPRSCWNRADYNERMFILLERDPVAIETVLYWIQRRMERGLNKVTDEKIREAFRWIEEAKEQPTT